MLRESVKSSAKHCVFAGMLWTKNSLTFSSKKKKGERKNKTGLKQGLEKKPEKNWSVTRILIEIGEWGEHSIINEHLKELHLIPLINLVFMICTVSYSQVFSAQIYDPRVKWENIQLWMNISRTCSNKYLLLTLFYDLHCKLQLSFFCSDLWLKSEMPLP